MDYKDEIEREISSNTICIYGKGTKTEPRCGFTAETIEFFNHFGYPFEVIDVLENMPKREALSEMTDWPTLPKVFIKGKFFGDTDILGPMTESGELQSTLQEAFGNAASPRAESVSPRAESVSPRAESRGEKETIDLRK